MHLLKVNLEKLQNKFMEFCPDQCLDYGTIHEKCCKFVCSCCSMVCKFNDCISSRGCDVIALLRSDVLLIELKSGRLSRDDVKRAIEELKVCLEYVGNSCKVVYAIIYYGSRVDENVKKLF